MDKPISTNNFSLPEVKIPRLEELIELSEKYREAKEEEKDLWETKYKPNLKKLSVENIY